MKDGQPQRSDERLFMQFLAFGGCPDAEPLAAAPRRRPGLPGVLYEDVNDPRGRRPADLRRRTLAFFLDRVRPLLNAAPFAPLVQKPELHDARTHVLARLRAGSRGCPAAPPAANGAQSTPGGGPSGIRFGAAGRFAQLPPEEQRVILAEHGAIGMSYGAGDYAHDIRLACHGLDKDDNDFVVGLIGKELYPLVVHRPNDAEDAADVAVPRPPRPVLRGPRRLAERPSTLTRTSEASASTVDA